LLKPKGRRRRNDGGEPKRKGEKPETLATIALKDYAGQALAAPLMPPEKEDTAEKLGDFVLLLISSIITCSILAYFLALSASYFFPLFSLSFGQWFVVAATIRLLKAK
jgi:hypothetical protein